MGRFHINTELAIKEGCLEQFKETIDKYVKIVKDEEPGTVYYVAHLHPNGTRCQIDQWFDDVNAFTTHLKVSGPRLAEEIYKYADPFRSWIYTADDSPEMKELIDSLGASDFVVVGPPYRGFDRDSGTDY